MKIGFQLGEHLIEWAHKVVNGEKVEKKLEIVDTERKSSLDGSTNKSTHSEGTHSEEEVKEPIKEHVIVNVENLKKDEQSDSQKDIEILSEESSTNKTENK